MHVFEVEMKVFGPKQFPQHRIAELNSGKTFYCFAQSGEPLTVKRITRTHTHTQTQVEVKVSNRV